MAAKGGYIHAIGRRKTAQARVYLKEGTGKITVNRKPYDVYFGRQTLRMIVRQPLEALSALEKYDILINVLGGGPSGQAGAAQLGIARALVKVSEESRKALRAEGHLTRDPRAVERKKYGRHKARRRPQYSKR